MPHCNGRIIPQNHVHSENSMFWDLKTFVFTPDQFILRQKFGPKYCNKLRVQKSQELKQPLGPLLLHHNSGKVRSYTVVLDSNLPY